MNVVEIAGALVWSCILFSAGAGWERSRHPEPKPKVTVEEDPKRWPTPEEVAGLSPRRRHRR